MVENKCVHFNEDDNLPSHRKCFKFIYEVNSEGSKLGVM